MADGRNMELENKKIKLAQMKEQIKKLDKKISSLETERYNLKINIENLDGEIKSYDTTNFLKEMMMWLTSEKEKEYRWGFPTWREFYIIARPKEGLYGSLKDQPDGTKDELYAIMEKYGMKEVIVESGDCDWGVYETYINYKRK